MKEGERCAYKKKNTDRHAHTYTQVKEKQFITQKSIDYILIGQRTSFRTCV